MKLNIFLKAFSKSYKPEPVKQYDRKPKSTTILSQLFKTSIQTKHNCYLITRYKLNTTKLRRMVHFYLITHFAFEIRNCCCILLSKWAKTNAASCILFYNTILNYTNLGHRTTKTDVFCNTVIYYRDTNKISLDDKNGIRNYSMALAWNY